MAEVRIDEVTAGKTIPVQAVRDSDGAIWDGVSAFAAASTYTDAALEMAINQAAMTFSPVVNSEASHIGYVLTLPAGVAAVACSLYAYDGAFSVGASARWSIDYDPSVGSILSDTNELQTNQGNWLTATSVTVSDKTGFSLAATGLDAITATEPSGKPTTFPGWLMWLVQRYRRSAKSTTALTVQTEAGATVTTQTITDDGAGAETLGPPA